MDRLTDLEIAVEIANANVNGSIYNQHDRVCLAMRDLFAAQREQADQRGAIFFRRHIPAFVDGALPRAAVFESLAEMLADPWIADWQDPKGRPVAYAYSSAGNLMAVGDNGRWWWVIGHLTHNPGLPVWQQGVMPSVSA